MKQPERRIQLALDELHGELSIVVIDNGRVVAARQDGRLNVIILYLLRNVIVRL
jgi:hypothetical protein